MARIVDLSDGQSFKHGFPHKDFKWLRREAPAFWHEPTEHSPGGEGFWVISRFDDIERVFRDPDTFSSERGPTREFGGTTLFDDPTAGKVLIQSDDPKHRRLRAIVSKGFTPATIARLDLEVCGIAADILDAVADLESFDFVEKIARELPLQVICAIVGVPSADRHMLVDWLDRGIEAPGEMVVARDYIRKIRDYARGLIAEKRRNPTDDILSIVVHAGSASAPAARLTDRELESFFFLLFAAGSETTRSAIGGAMLAFIERPDQLRRLRDEPGLMRWAIEEIVRWTSPTVYKRRTAMRDVEIAGQAILADQKVTVWEMSANRDERRFDRPFDFDIARKPNRHIGFGAGVHFCLGANLARLEIRCVLDELLKRYADFELTGEPRWTPSNRLLGLAALPVRLTPAHTKPRAS